MLRRFVVRSFEVGLKFRDGELVGLLAPGTHWIWQRISRDSVAVVSKRDPWLLDSQLDVMQKSGLLKDKAEFIDLKDNQRALVWVDGRFDQVLGPGLFAYWLGLRDVQVEIVTVDEIRFTHRRLTSILKGQESERFLEIQTVPQNHVGILYVDRKFAGRLEPGNYAFWKDVADIRVAEVDMRELRLDVSGQEILTADKVSLRINASVTYVVDNPRQALEAAEDFAQSFYREAQLALRSVVGRHDLDSFLNGGDELAGELADSIVDRATTLGLKVVTVGIRDVILPGDMRVLMNRVTEAKKSAEANLIARREETAAIRSQANTAKLLADNPTLMRLRELEVLEKIAGSGNLNVVIGEKGLADRVVNLL